MRSRRRLSKIKCDMRFAIFSYNLRVTRENFGLSQAELAAQCGIGLNTYSRIEGNKAKPKAETVILICEALGVGLDEMMTCFASRKN